MSFAPGRPRLAYVVNSLNPGGAERMVADMARAFADDFDLVVICLDEPGAWAAPLRLAGVPVYGMWRQPGLDLSVPVRMASQWRALGVQIVHAHQCTAWFYSALARLVNPAPRLLLQEHGRFHPEVDNARRRLVNRVLISRLTHRFVAVSRDIRVRLQRYEGIAPDRIEVIYNGVAPAPALDLQARERLRAELGFGPGDFVVGTIGRLDPIKNMPMLVDALASASSSLPALRGLLVGDGPARADVQGRIVAAGLEDRVRLAGHRDDARRLTQCLDLFVLTSLSEGTSVALLEAMAAGVPVAVTDVGGNPEVVDHGLTGWLVPSDDAGALAGVVREAASDSARRRRYAIAAQQRFAKAFTFDAMIRSYRAIYAQLLAERGMAMSGTEA